MLLTVSSCTPPLTMGVMMHSAMKMMMIAMYRPFLSRKSRVLKVYL